MGDLFYKSGQFTQTGDTLDLGVINRPTGLRFIGSGWGQIDCEFSFDNRVTWVHQRSWTSQTESTNLGVENGGMIARLKAVNWGSGTMNIHVYDL